MHSDGATPELRAKLDRQLERIGVETGKGVGVGVCCRVDMAADESDVQWDSDADESSGAEAEPLGYLMLAVASRLPEGEAAELLEKAHRWERRHARAERALSRHRSRSSLNVEKEAFNPQDPTAESAGVRARARSRHFHGADARLLQAAAGKPHGGVALADAAESSDPSEYYSVSASSLGAAENSPAHDGELRLGGNQAHTSEGVLLRNPKKTRWLFAAVLIACAALCFASGTGSSGSMLKYIYVVVDLLGDASTTSAKGLGEDIRYDRVRERTFELAVEKIVQQEVRRGVERAAESLAAMHRAAREPFEAAAGQPGAEVASRAPSVAALHDRVDELEEDGYQVFLRPLHPAQSGSGAFASGHGSAAAPPAHARPAAARERDALELRSFLEGLGVVAADLRATSPEEFAAVVSAELGLGAGDRLRAMAALRKRPLAVRLLAGRERMDVVGTTTADRLLAERERLYAGAEAASSRVPEELRKARRAPEARRLARLEAASASHRSSASQSGPGAFERSPRSPEETRKARLEALPLTEFAASQAE